MNIFNNTTTCFDVYQCWQEIRQMKEYSHLSHGYFWALQINESFRSVKY